MTDAKVELVATLRRALDDQQENFSSEPVMLRPETLRAAIAALERISSSTAEVQKLEAENARLKLEIAAIMRGELHAPELDGGQPINALEAITGKKRAFDSKAALAGKSGEGV